MRTRGADRGTARAPSWRLAWGLAAAGLVFTGPAVRAEDPGKDETPVVVPPITAPPSGAPSGPPVKPPPVVQPPPAQPVPVPEPGATPPPIDRAELEKAVAQAITKGVAWLKKKQQGDGSFGDSGDGPTYGGGPAYHNRPGIAAISLLALLKSDVAPDDPVIIKGFKFLYDYVGRKDNTLSVYEMGVTLMAIEALYEGTYKALLKKQGKKVTERPGDFKEPKYAPSPGDAKFCEDVLKRLYRNQTPAGGWRYGEGFGIVGSDEDISATQIAMLGIKSASRMRLPVDFLVVRKAMTFVIQSQELDGPKVPRPTKPPAPGDRKTYASTGDDRARGWAYEKKSEKPFELAVTGSMTTAGITTLLIGKSILGAQMGKREVAEVEQSVWDGFAWLTLNWSVTENPKTPRSYFYYLYGIERVGALGLYDKIGTHDWYLEGADAIVRQQGEAGCWDSKREVNPSDLFDTCFALLFLRRGTVGIGDVLRPRVYTKTGESLNK